MGPANNRRFEGEKGERGLYAGLQYLDTQIGLQLLLPELSISHKTRSLTIKKSSKH